MRTVIFQDKKLLWPLAWRALRWHVNYFLRRKPSLMACGLYITGRCNFNCNFCNIRRKPEGATLPLEKAQAIIDDLSALGCFYFSITGGEPLLVDHVFDVLAYARRSRIRYIHMVTNGSLLDKEKALKLKGTGINEISISIDGSRESHDTNRGLSGAYDKALAAVETLKRQAPRIKIVLNTILRPQEPEECLHVVELAKTFNVALKVQPLNQHPVFDPQNHVLVSREDNISPERLRAVITRLREEDCVVSSGAFLENIYNFFCRKEDLILQDAPCLLGYHHLEVMEDGTVFPCLEGFGWKDGMRPEKGIKQLLASREYRDVLKKLETCRGCRKNYYICYYEPRIAFPIGNFLKYRGR